MPLNNRAVFEKSLGSGINYPDIFSELNGSVKVERGTDKINQSIADILGTRIGERFGMPEYGSQLYEVLFEPNDYMAKDMAIEYIKDALNRWEDRIEILNIEVSIPEDEEHKMDIIINYIISRTNIKDYYQFTISSVGREVS